jgi:hypothetical protein
MGFAGNSNIGETPPPEFGDLVVLRGLDFADVIKLSETVPTTFRNLSHLEVLNVIKTGVKGPFPVGICVNGFSPEIVTEEGFLDCPCCVKTCIKRCNTNKEE